MKTQITSLELLAPVRDLACGIVAVNHGADAIYIGGPSFGARSNAGNPVTDIKQVVSYAHKFRVKVYVALNTLLYNDELKQAEKLIWQLYDIGVDAIIIQDMGLLECNLPPIELHASTQTDNRTPEKVKFLEDIGFKQVVLARELSLKQIAEIRSKTTVQLESFIHGALCVSYSGQCYLSQVVADRSANRGNCAQFCRHKFTLTDSNNKIIEQDKYLLSLKDFNLANNLQDLVDAGISSFKIEGRLKGEDYVKNVTAFYRQKLDSIIEKSSTLQRASSGTCNFTFTPTPEKSFNRGATSYFINGKRAKVAQTSTPKSMGQKIGSVTNIFTDGFLISTKEKIQNGDGLCYFDKNKTLQGIRVNKFSNGKIFTRERITIEIGTTLFRNLDTSFQKELANSKKCRTISLSISVLPATNGIDFLIKDEDGLHSTFHDPTQYDDAKNEQKMVESIKKQFKKSGDTIFEVQSVHIELDEIPFMPVSQINTIRRNLLEQHEIKRINNYDTKQSTFTPNAIPWFSTSLRAYDNVTNKKAEEFYKRHGVTQIVHAPELDGNSEGLHLMTTKYCIKYQLDLCPHQPVNDTKKYVEPFFLTDNTGTYTLHFDCAKCQMMLTTTSK